MEGQSTSLGIPSFACTPDLFSELMAVINRDDISAWSAARDIVIAHSEGNLEGKFKRLPYNQGMEYKHLVRDFALRTRQNLDFLRSEKAAHPEAEVFEVTQLINSMLGLLVFPQEKSLNRVPRTPLAQLSEQGWPIPQIVGDYPQVTDLNQLIRYLRNAVAHFNMEFISDVNSQICGLCVWNTKPFPPHEITWKAKLSVADMEKISDKFIAMLLEETPELARGKDTL